MFSPPASVERFDTGLRFTDILFGFVVRELFIRLQNWPDLVWYVRWQLVAGTALVLGSWIGFRRSLNRPKYEIKFFNLPFFRFVIDQLMVVFYFRVATLTPSDPEANAPGATQLVDSTLEAIVLIFALYAIWDMLGIMMALVRGEDGAKKYPEIVDQKPDRTREALVNVSGWLVTLGSLGLFGALWIFSQSLDLSNRSAGVVLATATVLLLAYRMAKEIRTSWSSLSPVKALPRP